MSEITEDSLQVVGGRGPGRPRSLEASSKVSTWIPTRHHDLLMRLADERSTSVSEVMRCLVDTACKVIERRRSTPRNT